VLTAAHVGRGGHAPAAAPPKKETAVCTGHVVGLPSQSIPSRRGKEKYHVAGIRHICSTLKKFNDGAIETQFTSTGDVSME
jgi:hypothetical protein